MKVKTIVAAAALWLGCAVTWAQQPGPDAEIGKFLAELTFRDGAMTIPDADATLALDSAFHYLDARDARRVLEEFWGNPPDDSVLGMVVPRDVSLADDTSWAVVVTFNDDGYVSDDEASTIDYAGMLQEMQESTTEENELRREQGYPTVDLVGWATAPRYDAGSKKLYWAKELAFEGSEDHTVNYDVRVLGRRGFLSLNAVASRAELAQVEAGMQRLIPQASFAAGEGYADFDESNDKVAAYGLAALVGGTLAAKTGLLGKLLAMLIAAKKILIPLAIGAFALVVRLFKRKGDSTPG